MTLYKLKLIGLLIWYRILIFLFALFSVYKRIIRIRSYAIASKNNEFEIDTVKAVGIQV